jgi:transglutaminase-like putative cysteine protease
MSAPGPPKREYRSAQHEGSPVSGRRVFARGVATPLTDAQVGWIGALIVAAQLPHLPSLRLWVALAGIAMVLLRLALMQRDRRRGVVSPKLIPAWALAIVALAIGFAIRFSYGYMLGREPCVAFLYVLVGIKFLEARSARDGGLVVCLASFLIVTPFFYSQSPLAAVAALPAILLVGAALDKLARTPADARAANEWKAPLAGAARLLLHGIPLAALLFILFPRLAAPLWGLPTDQAAKSGLSDSMAPGTIRDLSLSDAIAFRVDFDGPVPQPQQRYWRGPVLSRFDGRTWSVLPLRQDGTIQHAAGTAIAYTVTLEPHYKPWLFALDFPVSLPRVETATSVTGPSNAGEIAGITRSQQLLARSLVIQPLQYRVRSVLRDRFPADVAIDAADNLELPSRRGFENPRTIEFATTLRAEYPDNNAYIRAVLSWFRNEKFVYTLTPALLESDPVDGFLFDSRRGFCEHYAGAFVLLLRAAGIPARVVTGYQGGEINPRGGYMIVRQSDAHAWAEALLDGEWVRYDPTAAVSPTRIEAGLGGALPTSDDVPLLARLDVGWFKGLQLTWDAINHDWRRHVIGFDYDRQRSFWREWNIDSATGWTYIAVLGGLGLAWVGLLLGWLVWRRQRRDRARKEWHALTARLARAGLPRLPYEGPLAYVERATARWPEASDALLMIGETYAALRYGPAATRADGDRERSALLARLAGAVQSLPSAARLRAAHNAPGP